MTWVALWVAFEAHGPHFRSLLAFLCEKRFCWFRAGADRKQAPRFGRPTFNWREARAGGLGLLECGVEAKLRLRRSNRG